MGILTLLFLWTGYGLGGQQGMTIALVLALAMNAFSYWFSDKIVLKMYRAREVSQSESPELYALVRRLTQKAGLPMPRIYLINQPQPNAFATGRNPEHAALAVTTGIMRLLNVEELEGVIGHELAHIKNRDILIGTIAATVAGAISYLTHMAQWAMIFGSSDDEDGGNPFVSILIMIVASIAAVMIQMAISRSREYAADAGGARIAGNPLYLSSALRKLRSASQQIPMAAQPATAHMFIVNPLSAGKMAKLFSTHPPMEERIARLESMQVR
ncbi:MAG: protease HtpX [Nitrospira bacterium SG8_35_4]|nr:MAG: protease HtpX [Nitrospira bacterium SG8_35_4]